MKEKITHTKPTEDRPRRIEITVDREHRGYVHLEYRAKPIPHYFVSDVRVKYDFQQRKLGFGTKLMNAVEEKIRELGIAGVLIDAIPESNRAHGMYARRGWIELPKTSTNKSNLYAYNLPEGIDLSLFSTKLREYEFRHYEREEVRNESF